jgi:uncharacterized membrane protein
MSDIPPPPPPVDAAYDSPSSSGSGGPENENDKLMAAVAHAAPLLDLGSGIAGTVIVLVWFFGFKEKTTPFIAAHLKQSIYLLVASFALFVTCFLIGAVTCVGFLLFFPAAILILVLRIMAAMKAYAGEDYRYPVVGGWSFLG